MKSFNLILIVTHDHFLNEYLMNYYTFYVSDDYLTKQFTCRSIAVLLLRKAIDAFLTSRTIKRSCLYARNAEHDNE